MAHYICYYRHQRVEVDAPTSYEAQQEAARQLRAVNAQEIEPVMVRREDSPADIQFY